ncbi:unnamed protein product, partial [Cuscuta epithymum]
MMVYVDRVVLYQRSIDRKVPVIIGWNAMLLREREIVEIEAGGFGLGYVDDEPLQLTDRDGVIADSGSGDEHHKLYVKMFAAKASDVAKNVVSIIAMASENPACLMEQESLMKLKEACEKLIALAQNRENAQQEKENSGVRVEPEGNGADLNDDDFWNDPKNLAILETAEKNVGKVGMTKKNTPSLPSFSIGLTQEERDGDVRRQGMEEIGRSLDTDKAAKVDAVCTEKVQDKVERAVVRTRRETKVTDVCKSPFIRRPIDALQMCTSMVKRIMAWMLDTEQCRRDEILFQYEEFAVAREDMLSLGENKHISAYVLDVWSVMLNGRESLRSTDSPCRMFARAYECLHSWVGEETPEAERLSLLYDAMEFGLAGLPADIDLENVELFFFPIMQPRHCYVICFNVMNQQMEILDASKSTLNVAQKYGEMPNIMRDLFVQYMTVVGFGNKVKGLKTAKVKKVA